MTKRKTPTPATPAAAPEDGLPFNRVLHPDDYQHPALHFNVEALRRFRDERMRGLFYRNDHRHRDWEYAEVLRKLAVLMLPAQQATLDTYEGRLPATPRGPVRILDTGFGCSYFTQYLALEGYDIHASDSEAYGEVRPELIKQCMALGTRIPLIIAPVEDHGMIPDGHFDVSMCISVIEHIPREAFERAWAELARVTKPGGYVFITSDYFRDHDHWLHSEALGCQHNPFMPSRMDEILFLAETKGLHMVGTSDFTYKGDFVNNYSFVTLTFQKA